MMSDEARRQLGEGERLMPLAVRRVPMLFVGLLSMACGAWLGLVRLGWNLPLPWQDQLIAHGPLMVCGFLGTLISLERAVGARLSVGVCRAGARRGRRADAGRSVRAVAFGPALITAGSLVMVAIFVGRMAAAAVALRGDDGDGRAGVDGRQRCYGSAARRCSASCSGGWRSSC